MLADRLGTATIVLLCSLGAAVVAVAEDETPDMALLEYLGSWEDSDADWMLLVDEEDVQVKTEKERSEPVSDDEASQESEHES